MENDGWNYTIEKLKRYDLDQSFIQGNHTKINCNPEGFADLALELICALKAYEDGKMDELSYQIRTTSEFGSIFSEFEIDKTEIVVSDKGWSDESNDEPEGVASILIPITFAFILLFIVTSTVVGFVTIWKWFF